MVCRAQVSDWGNEAQLLASTDIAQGDVILSELPLIFAEVPAEHDGDGPWILLEAILESEATQAEVAALDLKMNKWPLSKTAEARIEQLARKFRRKPKKVAQLYHRVASNNIRYGVAPMTGYGIWPMASRSNHSCSPNAQLRAMRDRPLVEILIATRDIVAGEAICWNYMSEEGFLELDWLARNAALHRDFQFLCRCDRCRKERPPELEQMSRSAIANALEPSDGTKATR